MSLLSRFLAVQIKLAQIAKNMTGSTINFELDCGINTWYDFQTKIHEDVNLSLKSQLGQYSITDLHDISHEIMLKLKEENTISEITFENNMIRFKTEKECKIENLKNLLKKNNNNESSAANQISIINFEEQTLKNAFLFDFIEKAAKLVNFQTNILKINKNQDLIKSESFRSFFEFDFFSAKNTKNEHFRGFVFPAKLESNFFTKFEKMKKLPINFSLIPIGKIFESDSLFEQNLTFFHKFKLMIHLFSRERLEFIHNFDYNLDNTTPFELNMDNFDNISINEFDDAFLNRFFSTNAILLNDYSRALDLITAFFVTAKNKFIQDFFKLTFNILTNFSFQKANISEKESQFLKLLLNKTIISLFR